MSARKPINDDDRDLFRQAVGEVRPVTDDRVAPPPPTIRSSAARRSGQGSSAGGSPGERDDRSVMAALLDELSDADFLETGEHLAYAQDGVPRSVLRKLRTGRYAVQGEIDLHGLTVAEARIALSGFLVEARLSRRLCVRVIHGKGRKHVESAPRLKPAVNQWLQRNRQVLAFCSARSMDGGTGAVYVLLRRPG